ncbi:signal peptidase II [Larsenimonas salina]|uniref:signal peptidase II n=1 Tax=Larsenimonas salina TaxID=1295565 RepID=UPI002072B051|nr:signal peptidase II [Larsenimonas salina]MCM5705521.1 signal peptidase II [Larsenimonas salina]
MPETHDAPLMRRPLRWWLLSIVIIALDLGTKLLMTQWLSYAEPREILPFFDLTLLHNTGAAFSFLAGHDGWQRWLFAAIAVGAVVALTLWLKRLKANETLTAVSIALIMGGALGNLYDRVVLGYVVDFLSFHWQNWYFPAFNLADTAITLGAIGLVLDTLLPKRTHAREVPNE